jgi:hypothetical protein
MLRNRGLYRPKVLRILDSLKILGDFEAWHDSHEHLAPSYTPQRGPVKASLFRIDFLEEWLEKRGVSGPEFLVAYRPMRMNGHSDDVSRRGRRPPRPGDKNNKDRNAEILRLAREVDEHSFWKCTYTKIAKDYGMTVASISLICRDQGFRRAGEGPLPDEAVADLSDVALLQEIHDVTSMSIRDATKLGIIREILDKRFSN